MAKSPKKSKKPTHITDRAAAKIKPVVEKIEKPDAPGILGPSTNAATNMLIADIALRGIGHIVRRSMHKGVLSTKYSGKTARNIVENQSFLTTMALYGVTKLATRSVPGAMVVAGGMLAKTLYDRRKSKRAAKRDGERTLARMAKRNRLP